MSRGGARLDMANVLPHPPPYTVTRLVDCALIRNLCSPPVYRIPPQFDESGRAWLILAVVLVAISARNLQLVGYIIDSPQLPVVLPNVLPPLPTLFPNSAQPLSSPLNRAHFDDLRSAWPRPIPPYTCVWCAVRRVPVYGVALFFPRSGRAWSETHTHSYIVNLALGT